MFAACSGLAYLLSNSLAIENYFGCFFALPIVLSSMRSGRCSWQENHGGNCCALVCLVWSTESIKLYVNAWFAWLHNGFSMEIENKLGCLDLLVISCSGCGSFRICYIILIFNRREHSCPDYCKYSCFSHVHSHIHKQSDSPIYEFYIHPIRDSAFDKLCFLRVPAVMVGEWLFYNWSGSLAYTNSLSFHYFA